MTNINSFNSGQVNSTSTKVNTQPSKTEAQKEASTQAAQVETKQISEKDTFAYMSGAAAYNMANVKLSPQALVNKYNSPEAIARIEAMMGNFVEGTVAGLAKFEEEFGASSAWTNLSESDKLAAAADFYTSQSI